MYTAFAYLFAGGTKLSTGVHAARSFASIVNHSSVIHGSKLIHSMKPRLRAAGADARPVAVTGAPYLAVATLAASTGHRRAPRTEPFRPPDQRKALNLRMAINPSEPAREPWVFLLGRPPMAEYLSFLVQASPGQNVDLAAAVARWRKAADVIDGLAASEVGIADNKQPADLPLGLHAKAQQYVEDPTASAAYALVPAKIGLIDLQHVVVYQRQINLAYADQLQKAIGDWGPDDERLLDFCLATDQPPPPIKRYQASDNTFVFQSESTDARFLGSALLDASQVTGHTPPGRAQSAVVLYIGYGMNALTVMSANRRLILSNGSHRAYALMAASITRVPALIQQVTREEELQVAPKVLQDKQLYLQNPRPPMLKDYFREPLHEVIHAARRNRQIRVQYVQEQMDTPG
jgi:hypothetical protein